MTGDAAGQPPEGEIVGLKARGGFTVDMAWEDGRLTRALIHSPSDQPLRVAYRHPFVLRCAELGQEQEEPLPGPAALEHSILARQGLTYVVQL